MSFDDAPTAHLAALESERAETRRGAVALGDLEPELAREDGLSPIAHLRLAALELTPGSFEVDALARTARAEGPLMGFWLQRGALAASVQLAGQPTSQLVTAGGLLLRDDPGSDSLIAVYRWYAMQPTVLVALDDRFVAATRRAPSLLRRLCTRAATTVRHAQVQQAISQLPRIEDRILAWFWSVADELGHVLPEGIHVPLTMTHTGLGQMVGARRPTVSLGLRALAESGSLRSVVDGWVLAPESREVLARRSALGDVQP